MKKHTNNMMEQNICGRDRTGLKLLSDALSVYLFAAKIVKKEASKTRNGRDQWTFDVCEEGKIMCISLRALVSPSRHDAPF